MNVYDIETVYSIGQKHSVVARSMGDAERIFQKRYGPTKITAVTLHSEYVLIQGIDDAPIREDKEEQG